MIIKINSEIIGDHCPDADVELACVVEEGLLDVLLNDPERDGLRGVENKVCHILVIPEDFNATSLVQIGGFHQPYVLFTVLWWDPLVPEAAFTDFSEPMQKVFDASIVEVSCDNKGCGRGVEHRVASLACLLVSFVVVLKRANETCFLADASVDLQMVK